MRAVIQRVLSAQVTVDDQPLGAIQAGLLVLVGAADGDGPDDATHLADKVARLRIFSDAAGRFQHSLLDMQGEALVVSQFTLLADTRRGRRPSFTGAAHPDLAAPLVDAFAQALRDLGVGVQTGRFGAHMVVSLQNDGPVTITLDTRTPA